MRFIHTSDWHLGKIFHRMHLTNDQEIVLEGLKDILRAERPDALIISGDIYDRAIPPVEAVDLFSNFTQDILMETGIPIIAIAGNHDSPDRIHYGSKLLAEENLHIIGKSDKGYEKISLEDEYGQVDFYVIPYADPGYIKYIYQMNHIKSHDDAFREITKKILEEKTDNRSVIMAHAYVQGGNIHSESERPLSIGGTDIVSADHFKHFNYAALGHLHAPQRAGEDYIRYSGSLMKYSTSEATQKKCVYMVELDEDGQINYDEVVITPPKDVRIVKGLLEDVIEAGRSDENSHDYIRAIIEDEGALLDPMEKIRAVYPNAIAMERTFLQKQKEQDRNLAVNYENYNKMSISSLFEDFYGHVTGSEFTEDHKKVFEDITKGLERG
ncbi:MAG: exonuclease SbcCD subunit D [Epulopiscium sp.]|nr:exonuclease SbcCD subunit D [Candidatus Epulonipiscium sp.]